MNDTLAFYTRVHLRYISIKSEKKNKIDSKRREHDKYYRIIPTLHDFNRVIKKSFVKIYMSLDLIDGYTLDNKFVQHNRKLRLIQMSSFISMIIS